MFAVKQRALLALFVILLAAPSASAQPGTPAAAAAPTPKGEDFVSEKGFRNRIFEIRHRDPVNLVRVLVPLGSGFRGAMMTSNNEFRTITVRDFPENIAVIEEAVKRLDVPEPPRPGIEFHVHILIASNSGTASNDFPAELNEVMKQLQTTIKYKNYYLMASQVMRAKEQGFNQISSKGVAELKLAADTPGGKNPIFYDFSMQNIVLDAAPGAAPGQTKIAVDRFNFSMKIPLVINQGSLQYETIGFTTPVSMREGEKVVVGTTSMEDKGIIVVLTANVTR